MDIVVSILVWFCIFLIVNFFVIKIYNWCRDRYTVYKWKRQIRKMFKDKGIELKRLDVRLYHDDLEGG